MSTHLYKLTDSKLDTVNMRLLYISESKYENDWISLPHSHHFTELFYVLNGKGEFVINDKTFEIQKDDFIIVNSNVSHNETSSSEDPLHYVVMGTDELEFEISSGKNYFIYNFASHNKQLLFYIKSILAEMKTQDDHFEYVCQNLFQNLIYQIQRWTKIQFLGTQSQKTNKECRFIEQYLNEHFREDISLQSLSEIVHLSKYYLAHAFKEYRGVSPINYLTQIRINEAKHLLETTDFSAAKIADFIGFSSQSYFSQIFHKETGMTPNQYRKNAQKCQNPLP